MDKQYILVVEDETDIREMLMFNLKREGYHVQGVENGIRCLEAIRHKKPHLIILDIMMPEMDGLATFKEMSKHYDIPVLFLSAKGEEIDRIVGLELGAHDYVVKPFSIRELMLRIKRILKRNESKAQGSSQERHNVRIDENTHKVFVGEEEVIVTLTEFRLLQDLMRHGQTVRTREQLLESVWGYEFDGYNRTVDTHVRRLRAKLGENGDIVETVRGLGYRVK